MGIIDFVKGGVRESGGLPREFRGIQIIKVVELVVSSVAGITCGGTSQKNGGKFTHGATGEDVRSGRSQPPQGSAAPISPVPNGPRRLGPLYL